MLYSQFYRENKEVIDTEILPYVSSYNLGLDGGRPRIMYRKWSWDLAIKLQDTCFGHLKRNPIYTIAYHNGEPFREWDYARMERAFALLGLLILKHIYKQDRRNFNFPVE